MSLGITEILLILVVILILFGGKRIPELARAFGQASYEFKKVKQSLKEEAKELEDAAKSAVKEAEEVAAKSDK